MRPNWVLQLEEAFEKTPFESLHIEPSPEVIIPVQIYADWLNLFHNQQMNSFFNQGREMMVQNITINERIFILSWLILGCENINDLKSRSDLMISLKKMAAFDIGFQADSMILYFDGISAFYTNDFDTAESKLLSSLKLFDGYFDYTKTAQIYLNLAMISKRKNNLSKSRDYIKKSLDISSRRNLHKLKNRCLDLIIETVDVGTLVQAQSETTLQTHQKSNLSKKLG